MGIPRAGARLSKSLSEATQELLFLSRRGKVEAWKHRPEPPAQSRGVFREEIPLACTLSQPEQMTRNTELNDLFKHVQQTKELPDGYALRFPGSDIWANTLLQFITYELYAAPFSHSH